MTFKHKKILAATAVVVVGMQRAGNTRQHYPVMMKEQHLYGGRTSTTAAANVRWIVERPAFITILEMTLLLIIESRCRCDSGDF